MKTLSAGVTDNVKDLNRVLTNVKARGTWAEVQLGNILDETIPGMYETNVQTNPAYNGRVEFAVKIPNSQTDDIAYLPISGFATPPSRATCPRWKRQEKIWNAA